MTLLLVSLRPHLSPWSATTPVSCLIKPASRSLRTVQAVLNRLFTLTSPDRHPAEARRFIDTTIIDSAIIDGSVTDKTGDKLTAC